MTLVHRFGWITTALVALALAGATALARAQGQEGFVKMSPDDLSREVLPATPLVFIAYALVWLGLLAYVMTLWRRLGRVERELADVHAKLRARQ